MKQIARWFGASLAACLLIAGPALAQDHAHGTPGAERPETEQASSLTLNPAAGSEIGAVYEAYLSPHQEGGEEEDTPAFIPPVFRSTAPSVPRAERTSRGHAALEFTRDLSRAYVYLAVENVDPAQVVMLHLHCGRPGQLGPIIIDFGLMGDVPTLLADGRLAIEITNADIEAVLAGQVDPLSGFTLGCPIVPGGLEQIVTLAGMQLVAEQGELYFNLHTAGQVYFGDIRGQFQRVNAP